MTSETLLAASIRIEEVRLTGEGSLSADDVAALRHWISGYVLSPTLFRYFDALLTSHENLRTEKLLVSILHPTE